MMDIKVPYILFSTMVFCLKSCSDHTYVLTTVRKNEAFFRSLEQFIRTVKCQKIFETEYFFNLVLEVPITLLDSEQLKFKKDQGNVH